MDMNIVDVNVANLVVPISILYAGILGVMVVPMLLNVITYRVKNRISLGEGNDAGLIRRVRGHANFIETVPFALLLIVLVELSGGSANLVHGLGITLVAGRALHYCTLIAKPECPTRAVGMLATIGVMLTAAIWLLMAYFG